MPASQTSTRPASRGAAGAPVAGLWFGAVVCFVGVAAVYMFFVQTAFGQQLDEAALTSAQFTQTRENPLFYALARLPWVWMAASVSLLAALIAIARRRWALLAAIVVAVIGSLATTQFLKYAVFTRPDLGIDTLTLNSLPSGHTTGAAAAAVALMLAVPRGWRPLFAVAGTLYTVVAGASTILSYWHRPADVISAVLIVGGWALASGAMFEGRAGDGFAAGRSSGSAVSAGAVRGVVVVLLVVAVLAGALSALLYTGIISDGVLGTATNVVAGIALVTAVTSAVFAALTETFAAHPVLD